ncbi:MAG: hypothetical protein LBM20_02730 [Rikenellaceae bacterium]|jgi:transposase-like protein|nr:hypothetical protein [Rikenellaceae bacterium]
MTCKFCGGNCVKNRYQLNGKQRFRYKECHRKQQCNYQYHACNASINDYIVEHIKEGVGIRSLARLLKISTTTLIARIQVIEKNVVVPHITPHNVYEVDEYQRSPIAFRLVSQQVYSREQIIGVEILLENGAVVRLFEVQLQVNVTKVR